MVKPVVLVVEDEAAIADMAKRFEALTGLWLATRGRKAA